MKFRVPVFLLTVLAASALSGAEIVVYGTTDLHASFYRSEKEDCGGIPAVMTAISADLEQTGRDRSVLIDCGDIMQGTLEGSADHGKAAVDSLNRAGYDVWVPGNHDFEFGRSTLMQRKSEFKGNFLCANLEKTDGFVILERQGIRIAVIGLTNPHLSTWVFGPAGAGLTEPYAAIDAVMAQIMPLKPHIIILAAHFSYFDSARFNQDFSLGKIAWKYPQIDLVLGGHSHQVVPGEHLAKSAVWYVQAGAHAGGFIRAVFEMDDETHQRISLKSEWVQVDRNAGASAEFPVPKVPGGKILKNVSDFSGKKGRELLQQSFCRAMLNAVPGIDVAFCGTFSKYAFCGGSMNIRELFLLCPFENTIITAKVSREEYEKIVRELEADNSMPQPHYGEPPEQGPVTIAVTSYSAAGAGNRFPVLAEALRNNQTVLDTGILVRDALGNYLKGDSE